METLCRQRGFHVLDPIETHRHFRVDHRIDRKGFALGNAGEGRCRPFEPLRVLRKDVQQDVAVNQYRHASSPRVSAMISSVLMLV
ncbi:MAG: hypothetical protein ACK56F_27230, partial [bacterium]